MVDDSAVCDRWEFGYEAFDQGIDVVFTGRGRGSIVFNWGASLVSAFFEGAITVADGYVVCVVQDGHAAQGDGGE